MEQTNGRGIKLVLDGGKNLEKEPLGSQRRMERLTEEERVVHRNQEERE